MVFSARACINNNYYQLFKYKGGVTMEKDEKERKIKLEIKKLTALFKEIDEDRKPYAERLIKRAAFQSVTLDEIEAVINEQGTVQTSVTRDGIETTKEHPASKTYIAMTKNYNSTLKDLFNLLPDVSKEAKDELQEFLRR